MTTNKSVTGEGNTPRDKIKKLRHEAAIARHFGQIAEWASKSFDADRLEAETEKAQRAAERAAFADHVYAASEPIHVPGENDAYEQARHDANGGDDE